MMKFHLNAHSFWSDDDVWTGKKNGYKAEIRKCSERQLNGLTNMFSYFIKTPHNKVKASSKDNIYFPSYNDCRDFIEQWINLEIMKVSTAATD